MTDASAAVIPAATPLPRNFATRRVVFLSGVCPARVSLSLFLAAALGAIRLVVLWFAALCG